MRNVLPHVVLPALLTLLPLTASAQQASPRDPGTEEKGSQTTGAAIGGFPDPTLLEELDIWAFVPDGAGLEALKESRGEELKKDPAALRRQIDALQLLAGGFHLDAMTEPDRQKAGDTLLLLSVLLHLQTSSELKASSCRRIVEELPDYEWWSHAVLLLAHHLHAAGRHHESNELLNLNQGKMSGSEDLARLLQGYNFFELGRAADATSTIARSCLAEAAEFLGGSSWPDGTVPREQPLFRLAWSRYLTGEFEQSKAALRDMWWLIEQAAIPRERRERLENLVVSGLAATYFGAPPLPADTPVRAELEGAKALLDGVDLDLPYAQDLCRLGLKTLWDRRNGGSEEKKPGILRAYCVVASQYLAAFPTAADCPVIHYTMAEALYRLSKAGSLDPAKRSQYQSFCLGGLARLVQLYGETGTWREANRQDSHVLDQTDQTVRKSLLELAALHGMLAEGARSESDDTAARLHDREAVRWYEHFLTLFPKSAEVPDALYRLGEILLFVLHDTDRAAAAFARCRDLEATDADRRRHCAVRATEAGTQAVMRALEIPDPSILVPDCLWESERSCVAPGLPPAPSDPPSQKRRIRTTPMPAAARQWLADLRALVSLPARDENEAARIHLSLYLLVRGHAAYGDFSTARLFAEQLLAAEPADRHLEWMCLRDLSRMCRNEGDLDCYHAVLNRAVARGLPLGQDRIHQEDTL